MYATSFLDRLGLDQAADERAIKRAYARELKQIDQEGDAAGFQVLRDAYELALDWVKQRPAGGSFVPGEAAPVLPAEAPEVIRRTRLAAPVAVPPPRDEGAGENPRQLAQAVFDEFVAVCGEMAAQGNARDSLLWRKHLQRCTGDARLLNISARVHFEFLIAHLLADGWRPGHEGLFVAARQAFGWEQDRRRLMEFGALGGWINQAIDECEMFTHQHSGDCSGQSDAVTRVREEADPRTGELMTHVPHLRNMVLRFPAWTSVIADRERIDQWVEKEQAIPKWRRAMRITRAAPGPETGGGTSWWKVVVFVVAIRTLYSMFAPAPVPSQPPPWNPPPVSRTFEPRTPLDELEETRYRRAAGTLYMPPGTRQLDPLAPRAQPMEPPRQPARPQGRGLTDAEMNVISQRVEFQWPETATGNYKVKYKIELDERGAISKMTKETSSGFPVLDRRVADAIRASAPFADPISRRFTLWYAWQRGAAKQKTHAPVEPAPDEPMPEAPETES